MASWCEPKLAREGAKIKLMVLNLKLRTFKSNQSLLKLAVLPKLINIEELDKNKVFGPSFGPQHVAKGFNGSPKLQKSAQSDRAGPRIRITGGLRVS